MDPVISMAAFKLITSKRILVLSPICFPSMKAFWPNVNIIHEILHCLIALHCKISNNFCLIKKQNELFIFLNQSTPGYKKSNL